VTFQTVSGAGVRVDARCAFKKELGLLQKEVMDLRVVDQQVRPAPVCCKPRYKAMAVKARPEFGFAINNSI
jgi:hypothetical protein